MISSFTAIQSIKISRKLATKSLAVTLIVIIIDLLTTRQILPYNNTSEDLLFIVTLTTVTISSVVLLGYIKQVVRDLYSKSIFVKTIFLSVVLIQFSIIGILVFMALADNANCHYHFSLCNNTNYHNLVNVISAVASSCILIAISFKFFSWYKTNYKNYLVLLFCLTAVGMIIALVGDNINELLLTKTITEKSPAGTMAGARFLYQKDKRYGGEIQYKIANPVNTTLIVRPFADIHLSDIISPLTTYPHNIFRWFSVVSLLYYYYAKRIGIIKFWILTSIPLILFLIGSGLIFSVPSNSPYKFFMRIVFRAGNIGNSILFGFIIYNVIRKIQIDKIKDYLTIAAMDIVMFDLAFSTSAFQPTYGIAAHSLVLLCACFISIGWYSLAISISQDTKLRNLIRNSAIEESKFLISIGSAEMKQEVQRRTLNAAREQQQILTKQTGIQSSLTENDMEQYLSNVLKEIKVLQNIDDILKKGKEILESSTDYFACSKARGIRLVYNNYFDSYEKVMQEYSKGEHKGIKLVTSIDKDNIDVVKKFLSIGVQIKHTKNMPPIDFAVSDKEMIATTEKIESEELIRSLLVTSEQPYISHFIFIFDELWKNGIDAKDRIVAIEQGLEPEFLEVITDHEKASQILVNLAKSLEKEALFLLPVDRAMSRMDRLGIIDYLIIASGKGAEVKIICPLSPENANIVKRISSNAPDIKILNGNKSPYGMFIADGEKFLRAELREPIAIEFSEAIGFTIYSNSKHSVESFKSVFELLWNERTLNERLKEIDKLKDEFINIAAHELRTPIQPILGLSGVLRSQIKDSEQQVLLDVIARNAKRLQRLSEDILDVTKIESQNLILKKERLNLNDIISNAISDTTNQVIVKENKENSIKIEFTNSRDKENEQAGEEGNSLAIIEADKGRISQVISNLLTNAVKFTNDGTIRVAVQRKDNEVIVSIKDTGTGIDSEILPRLFTKFATTSNTGTGLGLFISRSIVQAHGGRIWAGNNSDGKGATFYFSLPLNK
jgi:signal transduction histidine kinase